MTGGLLQIVTSGQEDTHLTQNPEITFFKKVFRRYTNYAIELTEIIPDQTPEFSHNISFNINIGDAIYRTYFEIELPNLSFSDEFIQDPRYFNSKNARIANYQLEVNKWTTYYINLKTFADIEIQLYRILKLLLESENITLNILKDATHNFNLINKTNKEQSKNKIIQSIFNIINITGYINQLNIIIGNEQRIAIIDRIELAYQTMVYYLNYYNQKKVKFTNRIYQLEKSNQINFSWAHFLGHNFFQSINLEIGGQSIGKYTNDILHINQMHRIKPNSMSNYLEMIGHTPELYTWNNNLKGGRKILVPLIFWFNKEPSASLPLVAMKYSNLIISAQINPINKIIEFENYGQMYDELLIITVENTNGFIPNSNLIYSKYQINPDDSSITYYCTGINYHLLKLQFDDLTNDEIMLILNQAWLNAGKPTPTFNTFIICKSHWIGFMLDIKNPIFNTVGPKVGSYYPFINFNQYYSLVPTPKIKLIAEIVYLDDVERAKFANGKLEYMIEKFHYDIFDIKNKSSFDCELSFCYPCKELYWYIQPQMFIDGISEYVPNSTLLYDTHEYFLTNPVLSQKLSFNQLDVIFNKMDSTYWTWTQSYKYLNNSLPLGVFYKSFCLYPEDTQPSGIANMFHIKSKQYRIEFHEQFLNEYYNWLKQIYKSNTNLVENKKSIQLKFIAKSYDLLVIHKGQAKLMFET
jgi:hypothetical protein